MLLPVAPLLLLCRELELLVLRLASDMALRGGGGTMRLLSTVLTGDTFRLLEGEDSGTGVVAVVDASTDPLDESDDEECDDELVSFETVAFSARMCSNKMFFDWVTKSICF